MLRVDNLARPTWSCIHFTRAEDITAELRAGLQSAGILAFDLIGEAATTRADFLRVLAQAMRFPAYFGGNWDAVIDCLRDLGDRHPAEGYVLFIHDAGRWWRDCWPAMGDLVEVWLAAAEESAHDDVPLHLVFVAAAA